MNLKERAKKLKTDIPALFLALKSKGTPIAAKLLAAIVVICALSPLDLIPDFIPVLGLLDDLIILPALVALTIRLVPPEVLEKCRTEARRRSNNISKKWYYAIPFVLIWLLLLIFILKFFIRKL
jgi:uncharacterized membrane protein YkvA (DUF1232 family)